VLKALALAPRRARWAARIVRARCRRAKPAVAKALNILRTELVRAIATDRLTSIRMIDRALVRRF